MTSWARHEFVRESNALFEDQVMLQSVHLPGTHALAQPRPHFPSNNLLQRRRGQYLLDESESCVTLSLRSHMTCLLHS